MSSGIRGKGNICPKQDAKRLVVAEMLPCAHLRANPSWKRQHNLISKTRQRMAAHNRAESSKNSSDSAYLLRLSFVGFFVSALFWGGDKNGKEI